jgi:hypothetical protein
MPVPEPASGADPAEEPVTRNILGPREQVGADEPPVIVSSMLADPALQMERDSAPMSQPMSEALLAFSEPPPADRKLRIAVFAVGVAALAVVGVWAGSSTQEVVQVQEMGMPSDGAAHPARSLATPTLASSVTQPEPGRPTDSRGTLPVAPISPRARDEAAVNTKAPAAQAIVPVVPSAASSAQSAGTSGRVKPVATSIRSSDGASKSATKVPTVRRRREATKPIAPHLDVIPNPYHD